MVKNPPSIQRRELDPWIGKIPWWRKWQHTPVFLPEKSPGQRSLAGYSACGCKELDTSKQLNSNNQFPRAAVKKCHKLSGLNNKSLFSHDSFWRPELEMEVSGRLVLSEAFPQVLGVLLTVSVAPWLVRSITLISAFIFTWHLCACLCTNFSFLKGHRSYWVRGPTPLQYNLILTNNICSDPIS